MGQNMRFLNPPLGQDRLNQICLGMNRKLEVSRLIGKAKTQHIDANKAVVVLQRFPYVVPIPPSGWKAMDQENHLLTGTGILIEDLMSPEFGRLPLLVPRSQSVTYSHDFPVLVQKV